MRPLNQLDDDSKPLTKGEKAALGVSVFTGLGCGLMVFLAGIVAIAIIVLLVI